MQYRTLGKSDVTVSAISFGAWAIGGSMWGGTDDEAAIRAIRASIDLGVTTIDTAAIYGMGHSERLVGQAIAGRREGLVIATKCGLRWDLEDGSFFFDGKTPEGEPKRIFRNLRPDSIRWECEQSLTRLGVDVIDLYQCHWPDPTSNLDDTMEVLVDLQRQGKIRAIGVSNFTPFMVQQCMTNGVIASDQPKYNLIERDIERDILPFCRAHAIGILAYSPMAMGLLTGKMGPDYAFKGDDTRQNRPWFSVENRQRVRDMLERIKPIADDHGVTLGQLALHWVIAQPGITTALAGARNEIQAAENLKAVDFTLSESELATIRHHAEALGDPV